MTSFEAGDPSALWAGADSVWRNYRLIGTQWTDLDTLGSGCDNVSATLPAPAQLHPSVLANTTMEAFHQDTSECMGCHQGASTVPTETGPGASAEFNWWHAAAVGQAAHEQPAMSRIDPGSPDTSYLWRKLSGTQVAAGGYGSQMPLAGGYLDADTMGHLEAWIQAGAPAAE